MESLPCILVQTHYITAFSYLTLCVSFSPEEVRRKRGTSRETWNRPGNSANFMYQNTASKRRCSPDCRDPEYGDEGCKSCKPPESLKIAVAVADADALLLELFMLVLLLLQMQQSNDNRMISRWHLFFSPLS